MKHMQLHSAATLSPSRSRPQWFVVATTLLALTVLAGCGQAAPERLNVYPVQGKLEVNGKPAAGAVVILHPKGDAAKPGARAEVQSDGSFSAGTYAASDGAPEGDYILTVEWFKPVLKRDEYVMGPNLVPDKYSKPESSQLEIHVAAQPNQLAPIKLKR